MGFDYLRCDREGEAENTATSQAYLAYEVRNILSVTVLNTITLQ